MEQTKTDESRVLVSADRLKATVAAIFRSFGVPPEDAAIAAGMLVLADLRGVESHGVSVYLQSSYVPGLSNGNINPTPHLRTVRETPISAMVDGDRGLGQVMASRAMGIAIAKAKQSGIGLVAVRNSGHYGAAQATAMMALKEDLIGISLTNGHALVLPTFGREPRLGTNPICVAVPTGQEPPFVLDMATSTVAIGKIAVAARSKAPLPLGWATDSSGVPTADAQAARTARRLLPLGGTRELGSHKGYGLGALVEVLTGVLSGGLLSTMIQGQTGPCHFLGAVRVDLFRPLDQFKTDMDRLLRSLRETPAAPGHDRVYYAGLPEWETERERRAHGIPLHPEVAAFIRQTCAERGVACEV
ncbi:MAG: Ldh family oxidoreductase [Chloroflexi bacterium]|nr:Ldh family oxidoreductase [Chloroflexota bacterium]